MTITFPLDVGSFADIIRMTSIRMRLVADQQISGLSSGQLIVADLAPKYWEFEVNLINMENALARRVQGIIESLDEGLSDFYLYDPRSAYPIADPTGSILGTATVKINSLDANNKELTLKALPAGYVLSDGDFLAFDFGTSPVHRALHRIVTGGTADGFGVTGAIEVRPHIRPGAAVDAAVTLIKPAARVKMIPNSFDPGTARQMLTSGMSFKARQVV